MSSYLVPVIVSLATTALVIRAGFLALQERKAVTKGKILIIMPFVIFVSYLIGMATKRPRYDSYASQATYETAMNFWFAGGLVVTLFLLHRTRFDRDPPLLYWLVMALCVATGLTIYSQFR